MKARSMLRRSSRSVVPAPNQLRFFWGSWGGSKPSSSSVPKPKAPSVFAKMNPPTGSASTSNKKVSLAESLSPAKVAAAIEASSGPTADPQQQKLIDAGLRLLESAKNIDKYSAAELQAIDSVAVLVFSDSLSATMPVYEQLQIISDAIFIFGERKEDKALYSALLDVLDAFVPPDIYAMFNSTHLPTVLKEEEDRLAFVGCVRLSLGDDFEKVGNTFSSAVGASSLVVRKDVTGKAKGLIRPESPTESRFALISLNDKLHDAVEALEKENQSLSNGASKKLLNSMFQILLEQIPQLAEQQQIVYFAEKGASSLRHQCEFVQLLAKLFAAFDPEETGKISYDVLKSSLERVGSQEATADMLSSVAPDAEGNIDYPHFLRVIRKSK